MNGWNITILKECMPSGMIKLTAVDYLNQVIQANYKHEILWNIFQKGETKAAADGRCPVAGGPF